MRRYLRREGRKQSQGSFKLFLGLIFTQKTNKDELGPEFLGYNVSEIKGLSAPNWYESWALSLSSKKWGPFCSLLFPSFLRYLPAVKGGVVGGCVLGTAHT